MIRWLRSEKKKHTSNWAHIIYRALVWWERRCEAMPRLMVMAPGQASVPDGLELASRIGVFIQISLCMHSWEAALFLSYCMVWLGARLGRFLFRIPGNYFVEESGNGRCFGWKARKRQSRALMTCEASYCICLHCVLCDMADSLFY